MKLPVETESFIAPRIATDDLLYSAVKYFSLNEMGRDFVVGDLHGMFPHLEQLLVRVDFDESRDRLFSVGDLVDRGPASRESLRWLSFPWFHACRGNHEQFAIDSVTPKELDFWVRYNGGEWWLDLGLDLQRQYRDAFLRMPMALEVETRSGMVGIVHADVPPGLSWDGFKQLLEEGDSEVLTYTLFSRNRINGAGYHRPVAGDIDRIYCGHTPVRKPFSVDNVHFIDTAAVYNANGYDWGCMTMVEIQPETHRVIQIPTGSGGGCE